MGTFISLVLAIAITIAMDMVFKKISYNNRKRKTAAWPQLAAARHLNFVPEGSNPGQGAYMTGFYRGHVLKLELIQNKHSNYARTSVFTSQQPGSLSTKGEPKQSPSFQEALYLINLLNKSYTLKGEFFTNPGGQSITYEEQGIIQDTNFLEHLFDLLSDLLEAYPVLVAQGGEAIAALQPAFDNTTLRPVILAILRDIADHTARELALHDSLLLCSYCLTRFGPHPITLSWWSNLTYYGCRLCGQSRSFYEGPVVAVLDSQVTDKLIQQNGLVRINWSTRRELFDFDAVEIVQASDEEVERFAVQVGNDTDKARESRYERMRCRVNPNCQLSDNTIRILERTFGQIIIGSEDSEPSKEFAHEAGHLSRVNEDEKL